MNTKRNKQFFESNQVVALRANKSIIPDEVGEILSELGNPTQAIPFYAIYGPGIDKPIKFEGLITSGQVVQAIHTARGEEDIQKVAESKPAERARF